MVLRKRTEEQMAQRRAYSRAYYLLHREGLSASSKIYRAEHREEIAARTAAYRLVHPEATRTAHRRFRARHPERETLDHRKVRHGIDREEQAQLFEKQEGRCGICREQLTLRSAHLDHCHRTGRIRGFLCSDCNRGLGLLRDDPDRLRLAIDWIS
jgi:Recombination endonuclease VII